MDTLAEEFSLQRLRFKGKGRTVFFGSPVIIFSIEDWILLPITYMMWNPLTTSP